LRLVRNLVLIVSLAFLPLLGLHSYLLVKREVAAFQSDMARDLRVLGHTLSVSIAREWDALGPEEALRLVDYANQAEPSIHIRWIPPEGPPNLTLPEPAPAERRPTTVRGAEIEGDRLYVRVPVVVGGARRGLVELSEGLAPVHGYTRATVARVSLLTLGLAIVSLLVAMVLGRRLVGRRLAELVEHARRVGEGDLSAHVRPTGKDEIALLARQMNAMSDELAATRSKEEKANAERAVALTHLRHADRLASVGRLASLMAHELGTPLNVVLERAKMVCAGDLARSETAEAASIIRRQAEVMTEKIRQVLGFVRRQSAPRDRVDVSEVAREALSLLQPLARTRGVSLSMLTPTCSSVVKGRKLEIEQVVTNLVINAIEAMPDGGKVEIEMASGYPERDGAPRLSRGPVLRLAVRDEGSGMKREELPRIFEPFFTTKPEGEGTGLGLWLVDNIVREHGGWIEVETAPGAGTRFSVFLPTEFPQDAESPPDRRIR
jgi:signal transduction histidine kinase